MDGSERMAGGKFCSYRVGYGLVRRQGRERALQDIGSVHEDAA